MLFFFFFHLGVRSHLAALREVVPAKNLPEQGELGERQLGHRDGESPRRLQVVYRLVRHRQVIIKYLETNKYIWSGKDNVKALSSVTISTLSTYVFQPKICFMVKKVLCALSTTSGLSRHT